jgi:hypothetical protein
MHVGAYDPPRFVLTHHPAEMLTYTPHGPWPAGESRWHSLPHAAAAQVHVAQGAPFHKKNKLLFTFAVVTAKGGRHAT